MFNKCLIWSEISSGIFRMSQMLDSYFNKYINVSVNESPILMSVCINKLNFKFKFAIQYTKPLTI